MNEQWPRKESDDFPAARNFDRNLQQGKLKGITKACSLRDDVAESASHQMRSAVNYKQGECRQPRESSRQKRLQNDQASKPVQKDPPPLTTEGSLADHFAVHKARARKGATSQLRHDLYAKEVGKPSWDDGGDVSEAPTDSWDNTFGGLGDDIALVQPLVKKKTTDSELIVIDFAAEKVQPPDPNDVLRKARAAQAAKTAAAWREVRATYNRRAPSKR